MESAKATLCVLGTGVGMWLAGGVCVLSSACCELAALSEEFASSFRYRQGAKHMKASESIRKCTDGISDVCGLIHEMRSESESDMKSAPYEKAQRSAPAPN